MAISKQVYSNDVRINGPKILDPKTVSYLLGTVVNRSEDTGEKNSKSYKVKFNIDGLPEFTEEYPEATPLFDSVAEVNPGDKIIVFNLSNSPGVYTFFYFPLRQGRFTGLKNYNNLIDITDDKTVKITFPGYEATLSQTGVNIEIKAANINITGNVNIEGTLKATQIITDAGVDLNTHVHLEALGTTGCPIV